MNPWPWRAAPIVALSLLALPALAKKNEDPLTRMTPVPADQPIPVSDFFREPLFQGPELNPAGTHFAALVSTKEDRLDLMTYDLATSKMERLTAGAGYDISNYDWLGDRRVVFGIVKDKLYATGLFGAELGKLADAYVLQRYNVMVPVGFPRDKSTQMVVWIRNSAKDMGADGGVMKIDVRKDLSAQQRDGNVFMDGDDGLRADVVALYPTPKDGAPMAYLPDRLGELAFAVTSKEGLTSLHRLEGGKWVRCDFDFNKLSIVGVGDAPGELLVLSSAEKGKPNILYRYDTLMGALGKKLFQDEAYDITGARIYRHPQDGSVLGIQYDRKGPQSTWFDESYAKVQDLLQTVFPNDVVRIIGSDKAQKNFFVSVYSDIRPITYYHLDIEKTSATSVSSIRPWIDPQRMQPMRMISYKARDGKSIDGYVTLPAGASKEKPAPLVVLPHGGPWERDNWGWDANAQFFASRGYAVFQPNYRGSTGYAWRFSDEDMWDFRKMHDDVTDGVQTVLKTGLIDRDRIAIMGGSFGGYLALCGAVYEKDLYRCAITIAGVFDWERVIKESRGSEYMRSSYGVLRRQLGDPKKNQDKFDEISPARHVNQIKIPVFVAHGTEDVVASAGQSKRLIAELKKYGVPYEKQIERGEGHGFRKLDHQVALYTAIEAFLAKNMAPRSMPEAVMPVAAK